MKINFIFVGMLALQITAHAQHLKLDSFDLSTPKGFFEFSDAAKDLAEQGEQTLELLQFIEGHGSEMRRNRLMARVLDEMIENDSKVVAAWLTESPLVRIAHFHEDSAAMLAMREPVAMIGVAKEICPLVPVPEPGQTSLQ